MIINPRKSVTLIELLIAIVLLSVVVLGFGSIDMFSHYHVLTADRRAQAQNEASYALEHMSKNVSRAIGNEMINGANTVVDIANVTGGGEFRRLKVYIDANNNGVREAPVANSDYWITYRYFNSGPLRNSVQFCGHCQNKTCNPCTSGWETVSLRSNKVNGFEIVKPNAANILTDNYIEATITACWDPQETHFLCGTPDNPTVTMRARIKMPSVSIN